MKGWKVDDWCFLWKWESGFIDNNLILLLYYYYYFFQVRLDGWSKKGFIYLDIKYILEWHRKGLCSIWMSCINVQPAVVRPWCWNIYNFFLKLPKAAEYFRLFFFPSFLKTTLCCFWTKGVTELMGGLDVYSWAVNVTLCVTGLVGSQMAVTFVVKRRRLFSSQRNHPMIDGNKAELLLYSAWSEIPPLA